MKLKRNFIKNKNGLAWIWAMCVLCVILSAIIYFPLSYTWQHLYIAIVGDYTFTGDSASAIAAIQLILSFLLALVLVALINWAIVNSKSSSYDGA